MIGSIIEDSGMSKTYRARDPNQAYLLPLSPRDWLAEGDLV